MIAQIFGKLVFKSPDYIIVDVHGVGFQIFISLVTFYELPGINNDIFLNTHSHIKEDSFQIYGFLTAGEKKLFQLLISVSKIGPKLALNLLSGMPIKELISCLSRSDVLKLSSIPKVGKKTAERLIFELKDKVMNVYSVDKQIYDQEIDKDVKKTFDDVTSALVNLGYKKNLAEQAVQKAMAEKGNTSLELLIKKSLIFLVK